MYFDKSFIEKVISISSVVDVVSGAVKLTKKGNNYVGLCPFHQEKTPSFTVSEEKGFFHCFGCSKSGNVIDFLIEQKNLSFVDAVKELALKAGLNLPKNNHSILDKSKSNVVILYNINKDAAFFFQRCLHDESMGKVASAYLQRRNITQESIKTFEIGYSPKDGSLLLRYLKDKGYQDNDLERSGLFVKNDNGALKTRFWDRIIFPVHDTRGQIRGFGGRALAKDAVPKYLNSPETEIFLKGNLLYGLYQSLGQNFYKTNSFLILEGYIDVVSMYQNGFKAIVAPLGTALKQEQINLLLRFSKEHTICFDGDDAGKMATKRAIEKYLQVLDKGVLVKIMNLPNGEDPDSIILQFGILKMKNFIESSSLLSDYIWDISKEGDLTKPEFRIKTKNNFSKYINIIKNKYIADDYNKSLYSKLRSYGNTYNEKSINNIYIAKNHKVKTDVAYEKKFLASVIKAPRILNNQESRFLSIYFSSLELKKVRNFILDLFMIEAYSLDSDLEKDLIDEFGEGFLNKQIFFSSEVMVNYDTIFSGDSQKIEKFFDKCYFEYYYKELNQELEDLYNNWLFSKSKVDWERYKSLKHLIEKERSRSSS